MKSPKTCWESCTILLGILHTTLESTESYECVIGSYVSTQLIRVLFDWLSETHVRSLVLFLPSGVFISVGCTIFIRASEGLTETS
jgi:hypothetical protein